ncbi:nitrogen regulation protein NR(II) [Thermodesulfobacteriota bacterium]
MTDKAMTDKDSSIINIAIVGGGSLCKEVLQKTAIEFGERDLNARFLFVADPDPQSPGVIIAKKLGLKIISDYHDLYEPQYNINLIIILTPEQSIFEDILAARPPHIRILSYQIFEIFWKAIGVEERKLRERTEEMETILNGIQDLISVITPTLEIIEVNEAFIRHMGYSHEEVIGKKCHEVFQKIDHRCDSSGHVCPLNEVVKNKRHIRQVMTRAQPGSDPRHYEVNIFPIWEKDGKISKFIEISRDITLRLKEEEEITRRLEQMVKERTKQLQETHDKLLHQDKMASLGKLAASVVHEINNPIAGVLNLTMLIKRIIKDGPILKKDLHKFEQYLDLMETETRRTSRIVSNLLTFSRQSKIELERVNLNKLIEQTLLLNSNLLKINRIKLEKRLDSNLPDIVGSSDQLQQVFMNFVSNAAEAMESAEGGVLGIETRHFLKDNKILVCFIDSGVGIPKEHTTKLFEPFFTTKKGKGAGLGLSVAYGIIQEHGGSIDVRSSVGYGSTFKVELPLQRPSHITNNSGGAHERH